MHWIEYLFPTGICALCGRPMRRRHPWLCSGCLRRIPFVRPPVCRGCGRPLRGAGGAVCRFCARWAVPFAWAAHLAVYEGDVRTHLHRLKYGGRRAVAKPYGALLAERLRAERRLPQAAAIVPIPLHARRLRERGYNQAELIARAAAEVLRRPLLTEVLVRPKETQSQSRLAAAERLRNVQNAFWVREPSAVRGRFVVLVDDVFTTGATCRAAAAAVLRAGAAGVGVACAAVAVSDQDMGAPA